MTKNPRNHKVWTNQELQSDPAGYLEAQRNYRADQTKAQEEARFESKLHYFATGYRELNPGATDEEVKKAFEEANQKRGVEDGIRTERTAYETELSRMSSQL